MRHAQLPLPCLADTDTYHSIRAELEHWYPKLVQGGVLIIDGYGHALGVPAARPTNTYPIPLAGFCYTGSIHEPHWHQAIDSS